MKFGTKIIGLITIPCVLICIIAGYITITLFTENATQQVETTLKSSGHSILQIVETAYKMNELEKIFDAEDGDDNEVAPVEEAPVARKAGIKTLAAQPKLVRVASKKAVDDLAGIWSKWDNPTLC